MNTPTIEEMAKAYTKSLDYRYISSSYIYITNMVKINAAVKDNVETCYISYDLLYNLWIGGHI